MIYLFYFVEKHVLLSTNVLSLREIKRLHEQNLIIDAKDGGLLLGPSHKEGGILFLFEYQDCFRVFGEVEGY